MPHGSSFLFIWGILLAAFTIGCFADKMSWSACDAGLTSFTPDEVTLTPDPPVIGSPATFVISGKTEAQVQGGTVDMVVSLSGIPIFTQSLDLCTKTTCPVAPGPISITLVEALPPIAPPGDYGLQVIARGPDGGELACVNVNFSLVLPSASDIESKAAVHGSVVRQPAAVESKWKRLSQQHQGSLNPYRDEHLIVVADQVAREHRKERLGKSAGREAA
ncbi:hypothetical protein Agub_g10677 [Astrephomene gubernaculifera]|uniref:MD-2-related lipid-recognition domain-containing protein n=1 Tax=Astrephomene gubernaculifera TaxID=47775 RepID=A0AAD3DV91_9CHLO|nr:hypothetical protein Agub_g10677 [Astrephomene gubernaculifera]